MIWILLGLILAFILTGVFMSVLQWICEPSSKRTTRRYYKRFLSVLRERDLLKHAFPKMSYKQIINFYEIPEVNTEMCAMNFSMSRSARDDKDSILVIYVRKEDCLCPLEMWINNRHEREKDGIILFVPKSYRDYKKLYDYFYNKGKKQKENEVTNAQLESLRYLKTRVHEAQDKNTNTLKKCQEENENIAGRVNSESKRSDYLNFVLDSDTTTEKDILNVINLCMKTGHYLDSDEFGKLNAKLVKMGYNKIIEEDKDFTNSIDMAYISENLFRKSWGRVVTENGFRYSPKSPDEVREKIRPK